MTELFYNYFSYLLHPIKYHTDSAFRRMEYERVKKSRLFALVGEEQKSSNPSDFVSFVTVSWFFNILYAAYSLAFIHLGLALSSNLSEMGYLPGLAVSSLFQKKITLIVLLFEVVLFPLSAWVYIKFWKIVITFFKNIFDKEIEEETIDEVLTNSLVGNFFLIIPVIGKMIKQVASVFYIFLGLKHNIRFSAMQSLIVIVSPLILVALFLLFLVFYVMLIINLL